jgi:hypothetical protein
MDLKIEKKIGEGVNGTVYTGEFNSIKCIIKKEKYDNDTSTKSCFIREIQFAEFAKKYPEYFMQLIYHGVIEQCDHKQPIPTWADRELRKKLVAKNKLTRCSMLVYTPVLNYTWRHKPKLTTVQYYTAIKQLVEAVDILRTNGYIHGDIHADNIMYNGKTKRWILIDYGKIEHKSFEGKPSRKDYTTDLMNIIWGTTDPPIMRYIQANNIKILSYDRFLKKLKSNKPIMDNIQPYIHVVNEDVYDTAITFLCMMLHPYLYIEYIKLDIDCIKFMVKPVDLDLMLYMIKHLSDKNYKSIITHIKKYIRIKKIELYIP